MRHHGGHHDDHADDPATALPGRPPVVDLATWQAARDELLVREKAHTREGDAIAAARRRLPMVEFDRTVEVTGPDGPVPFLDLFQGRDELVVYKHMWWDGAPHQGQCEGCTTTAWHPEGRGLPQRPRRLVRHPDPGPVGRRWPPTSSSWATPSPGTRCATWTRRSAATWVHRLLPARRRPRVSHLLHDGRGNEPVIGAFGLLDMTPYGRGEAWEDNPEGWPEGHGPCWYWRSDAAGNAIWGPTSRPVPQWTRPGATPVQTLGRGDYAY